MTSNSSTLILVSSEDALTKTKAIRWYHRSKEDKEIRGVKRKYCYVEKVSAKEVERLKVNDYPQAKQLIAVVIEGIVRAPDAQDESLPPWRFFQDNQDERINLIVFIIN